MAQDQQSQRRNDISQILTKINFSILDAEDRLCSICREPFEYSLKSCDETEADADVEADVETTLVAVRLPCTHVYCEQCITHWLMEQETCPYCMRVMLTLPVLDDSDEELDHDEWGQRFWQERANFLWQRTRSRYLRLLQGNTDPNAIRALAWVEENTAADEIPSDEEEQEAFDAGIAAIIAPLVLDEYQRHIDMREVNPDEYEALEDGHELYYISHCVRLQLQDLWRRERLEWIEMLQGHPEPDAVRSLEMLERGERADETLNDRGLIQILTEGVDDFMSEFGSNDHMCLWRRERFQHIDLLRGIKIDEPDVVLICLPEEV